MVCTDPLPKDRVPTRSRGGDPATTPATISEADADPPLISTTNFFPSAMSPGPRIGPFRPCRPLVITMVPRSRNESATAIAWSSRPSRIVTQIHHISLKLRTNLLLQILYGVLQINGGLLIEASNLEIANVALSLILDRYSRGLRRDELYSDRMIHTFSDDGQGDRRPRRPSHFVNGLLQR